MPRTRPPYSPEFRQQMVELVKTGRTPEELSREFSCGRGRRCDHAGESRIARGC